MYSLVNVPLWGKAEWAGVAYITIPDQDWPPRLALGFKNPEAAKSIFRGWLDKLGRIDREDLLKISIITGIDRDEPSHYKVVVGTNPQVARRDPSSSHMVLVSRIHRMEPPDLVNLNRFKKEYERYGRYVLLPARFIDPETEPDPLWEFSIGKTEIRIVPAWQIGEHDPDVVAIQEDANPSIPDDVQDAPVLTALARFKNRRKTAKVPSKVTELLGNTVEDADREGIRRMIEYLTKRKMKGHWHCYCGSGKQLRNCHIGKLLQLRKSIDVGTAKQLLAQLK